MIRALYRERRLRTCDWLDALRLVCDGTMHVRKLQQRVDLPPAWTRVLFGIGSARRRRALLELLESVPRRAPALVEGRETVGRQELDYATGLPNLAARRPRWLRPVDGWRPPTSRPRGAFASLANHLLARYPVPEFMAAAWLRRDDDGPAYRSLFLHIGRGNNPQTGRTPVPMTRRIAHHFLQAPARYSIEGAVRWGQIAALGGPPELADVCVATRLGEHFGTAAFWMSVIRWFVAHPTFDPGQVGPVVDFIQRIKFQSTWTRRILGQSGFTPAPRPGFSMAGRTPEALLRQMARWNAQRGGNDAEPFVPDDDAGAPEIWTTRGIRGMRRNTTRRRITTTWTVEALMSTAALEREGREMRHCVAGFAGDCAEGRCSIWSMKAAVDDPLMERWTVAIDRDLAIVEVRGKYNAPAHGDAIEVLRRWAVREHLTLPAWL